MLVDIAYSYSTLQRIGRHFDENQYNVIISIERYARTAYTTCVYNIYTRLAQFLAFIHWTQSHFSIIIECDQWLRIEYITLGGP